MIKNPEPFDENRQAKDQAMYQSIFGLKALVSNDIEKNIFNE